MIVGVRNRIYFRFLRSFFYFIFSHRSSFILFSIKITHAKKTEKKSNLSKRTKVLYAYVNIMLCSKVESRWLTMKRKSISIYRKNKELNVWMFVSKLSEMSHQASQTHCILFFLFPLSFRCETDHKKTDKLLRRQKNDGKAKKATKRQDGMENTFFCGYAIVCGTILFVLLTFQLFKFAFSSFFTTAPIRQFLSFRLVSLKVKLTK